MVEGESVVEHGKVWKEDVRSQLGYVEVVRELGMRSNGVMVDDQRVMVIAVSESFNFCMWFSSRFLP